MISHLKEEKSKKIQIYYFRIIKNEVEYLQTNDFFKKFKREYSLQGIDNGFLNNLELNKKEILENIKSDKLTVLYFSTFCKASIKHGENFVEKDLGSFFAKLVHTFRPEYYCALDNPIKNYFKLKKSFFLSFIIISDVYKKWSKENENILSEIRRRFEQADKEKIIKQDKLTDLKLLDLIFWSKSNRK